MTYLTFHLPKRKKKQTKKFTPPPSAAGRRRSGDVADVSRQRGHVNAPQENQPMNENFLVRARPLSHLFGGVVCRLNVRWRAATALPIKHSTVTKVSVSTCSLYFEYIHILCIYTFNIRITYHAWYYIENMYPFWRRNILPVWQ